MDSTGGQADEGFLDLVIFPQLGRPISVCCFFGHATSTRGSFNERFGGHSGRELEGRLVRARSISSRSRRASNSGSMASWSVEAERGDFLPHGLEQVEANGCAGAVGARRKRMNCRHLPANSRGPTWIHAAEERLDERIKFLAGGGELERPSVEQFWCRGPPRVGGSGHSPPVAGCRREYCGRPR